MALVMTNVHTYGSEMIIFLKIAIVKVMHNPSTYEWVFFMKVRTHGVELTLLFGIDFGNASCGNMEVRCAILASMYTRQQSRLLIA